MGLLVALTGRVVRSPYQEDVVDSIVVVVMTTVLQELLSLWYAVGFAERPNKP